MSRNQMFAWFNLSVIALTFIVFFAMVPVLGWQRAHGAIGFSGLMGLGVLFFFHKKPGQIIADERDNLIMKRSTVIAHAVFWVTYVFVSVLVVPTVYGWEGTMPVNVVQFSVFWAMILLQTTMSLAILFQYAGGSANVE